MKKRIILFTILSLSISVFAQKEYKIAAPSGRLNLNIAGATVEGYSGTELIFSIENGPVEVVDERAKGLKPISGSGFNDNTGLGLDISRNGNDIDVNTASKTQNGTLHIKVPQHVKISYKNSSMVYNTLLILRNLKSEVEVSASYNPIKLENNTGPMNIKAIYGSVEANFNTEIKGPISIISIYGFVDLSLPAATPSNLDLSTSYGKLYAANEFKITVANQSNKLAGNTIAGQRNSNYSSNEDTEFITRKRSDLNETGESIKGTINGGGADLILKSNYNNVYLRQK